MVGVLRLSTRTDILPAANECTLLLKRMASKKAGGSSRNGRKTAGKRLGLKCGDGKSENNFFLIFLK